MTYPRGRKDGSETGKKTGRRRQNQTSDCRHLGKK